MNDIGTDYQQLAAKQQRQDEHDRAAQERRQQRRDTCDHHYVYLRQTVARPIGPDDDEYRVDWFFCDRCLEHQAVRVG